MSDAATEILVRGAQALADSTALQPGLEGLLGVIAEQLDVESAAIVVVAADGPDALRIVASSGLPAAAVAGLAAALRNPAHPIARTVTDPVVTFDVLPSVPGGPALRSHLPLMVARHDGNVVVGVLALAHRRPLGAEPRRLLQAAADLAAVGVERHRPA
jgi:GAF domain-containing protein